LPKLPKADFHYLRQVLLLAGGDGGGSQVVKAGLVRREWTACTLLRE